MCTILRSQRHVMRHVVELHQIFGKFGIFIFFHYLVYLSPNEIFGRQVSIRMRMMTMHLHYCYIRTKSRLKKGHVCCSARIKLLGRAGKTL